MKKLTISAIFVLWGYLVFSQVPTLGEIRVFAGNFAPVGWAYCDGSLLPISRNEALFDLIGTTYGGDGITTFALPDLNQKVAIGIGQGTGLKNYTLGQTGGQASFSLTTDNIPHGHSVGLMVTHQVGDSDNPGTGIPAFTNANGYSTTSNASMAPGSLIISSLETVGGSAPVSNIQPCLAMNYIICINGCDNYFDEAFIGEIRMLAYNRKLPVGCLPCEGQILLISQYTELFNLIGITYGGNGYNGFALPDLRSRIPLGQGNREDYSYTLGQKEGLEEIYLTNYNFPPHTHKGTAYFKAYNGIGNANTPVNNYPAINPQRGNEFSTTSDGSSMNIGVPSIEDVPAVPVNNLQPYCTIQYVIVTSGGFIPVPDRN
jgi:microcystin-dependent protein